ncbi:hypothetical protein DL767_000525 [Monosporascus sp. MG133]|nr:hypothetical protein DL767_000525 [Monosporascus sp. MG133]
MADEFSATASSTFAGYNITDDQIATPKTCIGGDTAPADAAKRLTIRPAASSTPREMQQRLGGLLDAAKRRGGRGAVRPADDHLHPPNHPDIPEGRGAEGGGGGVHRPQRRPRLAGAHGLGQPCGGHAARFTIESELYSRCRDDHPGSGSQPHQDESGKHEKGHDPGNV